MTIALILSGGGARAAYQVGVLRGLSEICGPGERPFSIVCGTSAGAINAAWLANWAHDPQEGIRRLDRAWRAISAERVYDTSWGAVVRTLGRIAWGVLHGSGTDIPAAVLDNSPLRELMNEWLDFDAIHGNIERGALQALAITAMNYSSGESVAFHEGRDAISWERVHRRGHPAVLSVDHVIASASIPILFPPQRIDGEYYGDGALRQLNPLSPALHLGARRLFIVGVSGNRQASRPHTADEQPTIAQMAGHLLNREFIDNLEADIEHARQINELLSRSPPAKGLPFANEVDIHVVTPSIEFDDVAVHYMRKQPRSLRLLFRLIGARGRGAGASFASYLLFDGGFCNELIDAGYRDVTSHSAAIRKFLFKGRD